MPHVTVRQIRVDPDATVVDALRSAAAVNAEVEAYVDPAGPGPEAARRALTFGAWDRAADGAAALFAERGVGRGDVVCLLLPSSIEYPVCYAAALRLGAVTSGINPRLGAAEQASILERTRPVVTVVPAGSPASGPRNGDDAPALGPLGPLGAVVTDLEVRAAAERRPPPFPRVRPDDPVAVVWTSGTTGRPKGAVFDHRNLAAVAAGTDALSRVGDRRLSPLPFAHIGSMTRAWDEIAKGITTVLTPVPWSSSEAIRILEEEQITVGQGVPTQWALILGDPLLDDADLSALRLAGTGAAPVPPALVASMRQRLGVPVVVRYTSTETSLGTGTRPDDPDEVVAGTVGRPVPGVELEIVDDAGRPQPTGVVGRVRLRSGAAFRRYWDDPEASAAVRASDGWVSTGDFGAVGEDGNLRLAGREHERYIRGGYNVYPAEVEAVLAGHPKVSAAVVVGAPDPVLGEVGVAVVVADPEDGERPELGELRTWCRAHLADYKAPDAMVEVDALPLTPMMKVDRRALADVTARAAATRPALRRDRHDSGQLRQSRSSPMTREEGP